MSTISLTYGQPIYITAGTTITGVSCNYVGYDEVSTNGINWTPLYQAEPKEEQKNMFYNNINIETNTLEGKQKQYLLSRATDIAQEKSRGLEKTFGLRGHEDTPKTIKEALDRIKAGEYQIKDKFLKASPYGGEYEDEDGDDQYTDSMVELIVWSRTPEDRDGYNKAHKVLEADLTKARDGIVCSGDATAALAILEAFESSTVH